METLAQLNAFSAQDFERWLNRRLRMQWGSHKETRSRTYDFREAGFGESHIDALRSLFRKLSEPAQEAFRNGIGLLISHAKVHDFPHKGMNDLIVLAAVANATQVLDAFMPLIGESEWGKEHPYLVYDCASVLLGQPGREREAAAMEEKLYEIARTVRLPSSWVKENSASH